jgi:hypothetical protein
MVVMTKEQEKKIERIYVKNFKKMHKQILEVLDDSFLLYPAQYAYALNAILYGITMTGLSNLKSIRDEISDLEGINYLNEIIKEFNRVNPNSNFTKISQDEDSYIT